jgi:hydrogenase nickel incorporation protein HypB
VPKITIAQNILAANDTIAQDIQQLLASREIRTINLMSSPGAGKTTLLERTIELLRGKLDIGVIEGDIETGTDAERIEATLQDKSRIVEAEPLLDRRR